jgi:ribosomal protein S18 acetylase RimI-like enzyme
MNNPTVRQATDDDMPALLAIRNSPRLFEQYLSAGTDTVLFLVLECDGIVVGFARLKLPGERDTNKKRPLVSDICISAKHRCRGLGSRFMVELEATARGLGHDTLFVAVDPVDNTRALSLYKRLGYLPIQDRPYEAEMLFHDSEGNPPVSKKYWRIELRKELSRSRIATNIRQHGAKERTKPSP